MLGSQYINYCRISCPACKAGTDAFICSLQCVEVTGREDVLNNCTTFLSKPQTINFSVLHHYFRMA